ncbi:hypothetical protein [Billgrantia endophytica]|uniref:hypothetical protein n=1 Tax=Billgrantia endophytica TaxID=2033802 RepID=UPI001054E2E4|nr:hypothetical protein [Halomonas endophytica]
MTKRKFENKVKKEVEAIHLNEVAFFNLNILDIEPIESCNNDGEAMVQINLHTGNSVQSSILTLLYSKKVSKKEEKLNVGIFLESQSVSRLIKTFRSFLSSDVVSNKDYADVVDTTIAKHLLALYKDKKKEYTANPIGV